MGDNKVKTKIVCFYPEDVEILNKIEKENINFNRLVRSLLAKWFYTEDKHQCTSTRQLTS